MPISTFQPTCKPHTTNIHIFIYQPGMYNVQYELLNKGLFRTNTIRLFVHRYDVKVRSGNKWIILFRQRNRPQVYKLKEKSQGINLY